MVAADFMQKIIAREDLHIELFKEEEIDEEVPNIHAEEEKVNPP